MEGRSGRPVPNQFIINTPQGEYFQSYKSIIAFKPVGSGPTQLDERYWDYSATTGKYRNEFLGEGILETRQGIKDGRYKLTREPRVPRGVFCFSFLRDKKVYSGQILNNPVFERRGL